MSSTSLQKRPSSGALTIRKTLVNKFEAQLFLPKLANAALKFDANGELVADTAVKHDTEVVAATNVIAESESGKVFFLNSATEFVSTLPAPAAGLNFEFIVTAAPSGASYTIVTTSSANIIKGTIVTAATGAADTEVSGGDTISFVDGQAVAGDRVVLRCDGTNWFVYGTCSVAGGITITTAS